MKVVTFLLWCNPIYEDAHLLLKRVWGFMKLHTFYETAHLIFLMSGR